MQQPEPTGRVLQVNLSGGGVPKLPVHSAWVGRFGLDGDRHREFTVHGGPHKAVCLYGIEAIERLQAEGHPIEPGSAGENLTTAGIDWSTLPVGTRARIGPTLEIELSSAAMPCATQRRNFSDGKFSRISIDVHPSDSRMYARVIREGEVRPGDQISLQRGAPDSHAADFLLLKRLDRASAKANLASWEAAAEAGYSIDIVVDGDISMAASSVITGPAFNQASGLAMYPNLIGMVTRFFDERAATGWLWTEEPPWEGAQPETTVSVFAAVPELVPDHPGPEGLTIRIIGPDESAAFVGVYGDQMATSGIGSDGPNPWPDVYHRLAEWPHRWLFIAELDGAPAGAASLHIHGKCGWLRGGAVVPEARGQGIQRSLVAARARKAIEEKCDLVGSMAEPDGPSATNLERMGLRRIGIRRQYRYDPAGVSASAP